MQSRQEGYAVCVQARRWPHHDQSIQKPGGGVLEEGKLGGLKGWAIDVHMPYDVLPCELLEDSAVNQRVVWRVVRPGPELVLTWGGKCRGSVSPASQTAACGKEGSVCSGAVALC